MKGTLLSDFFEIIYQEEQENCLKTTVKINAQHRIFEGHFPNRPITPGVCIMQMTKEILMRKFNQPFQMSHGDTIKFMNPIDPRINEIVTFEVNYKEVENLFSVQTIVKHELTIFCKFNARYDFN